MDGILLYMQEEFDQQVQNLLSKEYPNIAGLSKEAFLAYISPLKEKLESIPLKPINTDVGSLPFVIVVTSALVPAEKAMAKVIREEKEGITKLDPLTPPDFTTIGSITLPNLWAYLLIDIDRGKETLNVRPQDALQIIQNENRSPLTIDEGIAIITHYPEFLQKNNCFSLLGSRHTGDQRVPAIWINGKKHPNLGWCWDGNPHTWLGSASARERVG